MRSPCLVDRIVVRATKTLSHRNTSATDFVARVAAVTCTVLVGQGGPLSNPNKHSPCARMVRVGHRRRSHQPERYRWHQSSRCRFTARLHRRSAGFLERQSSACESRRPRRSPAIFVDRFKSNPMQWLTLARVRVRRNCDCGVPVPEIEAAFRSNANMSISSADDIGMHFADTT